jgi:hypothetical protein
MATTVEPETRRDVEFERRGVAAVKAALVGDRVSRRRW